MTFDQAQVQEAPEEAETRPHDASGFGGTVSGVVAAGSFDTSVSAAMGFEPPDPLRAASIRAVGAPLLAGIASDILVRLSDTRLSLGTAMGFGDGPALVVSGVPDGFRVDSTSTVAGSVTLGIGRQLRIGPVMPYVDLLAGVAILQTKVRLHHERHGFLGETPYDAFRFSFGPRAGVTVPLGTVFHIDLGGRLDFFGFSRWSTFAGLGIFLPT